MGSFVLSELITNNIIKEVQNKSLQEQGLLPEFSRCGKAFHYFVQECVNSGKIQKDEVKRFLFDSLFYGGQRECYIYQVGSYYEEKIEEKSFLHVLNDAYDYIDTPTFNEITSFVGDKTNNLTAIKVIYTGDLKKIAKVCLLFKENVSVISKGEMVKTISYVPVEWDVIKKSIIVKTAPRRRLFDSRQKPENLCRKFVEKVKKLFGIQIVPFEMYTKK